MVAQIELPHLPIRLYRYRSLKGGQDIVEREIATITESYLWCSDFTRLNDPMEGFYTPSSVLGNGRKARIIKQNILDSKSTIGIASFAESYENELMWTHYADEYRGICIAYITDLLQRGLHDGTSLVRMAYGEESPPISAVQALDPQRAARIIMSHKKLNWYYEREWRVLGSKGKNIIRFEPLGRLIAAVYLGSRIESLHEEEITRKIRPFRIRSYKMTISGYSHKWSLAK
jgi:hypothetical protein